MSSFLVSPSAMRKSALPPSAEESVLSFFSNCGMSVATRVIGPASVVGKNETEAR